jgi:hypothetical protein
MARSSTMRRQSLSLETYFLPTEYERSQQKKHWRSRQVPEGDWLVWYRGSYFDGPVAVRVTPDEYKRNHSTPRPAPEGDWLVWYLDFYFDGNYRSVAVQVTLNEYKQVVLNSFGGNSFSARRHSDLDCPRLPAEFAADVFVRETPYGDRTARALLLSRCSPWSDMHRDCSCPNRRTMVTPTTMRAAADCVYLRN